MDTFIETLRNHANVRLACDKAGISRVTAYRWRNRWQTFADRWDEALEDATDTLEAVAWARATRKVAPSDRLLVLLLKAHRPDKYGDSQRIEHTGADGGPIEQRVEQVVVYLPDNGRGDREPDVAAGNGGGNDDTGD
jgi:hypothetical protein